MKKNIFSFLFLAIAGSIFLTGCKGKKQSLPVCDASQVEVLSLDTTVYTHMGSNSPSCKITFKLPFLRTNSDSISAHINQAVLEKAFGPAYVHLSPSQFIKAYSDTLISYHKADIAAFLEEDLKRGIQPAAWYNYEFDLEAELKPGLGDSIWNYTLTDFRQTGGAHPNTIKTCLNIEVATGHVLSKRDVFIPNADQALTPAIIKSLAVYLNGLKMQDVQVSATLEGLQGAGLFLDTDPYIPENFLLGKDSVTFYYNRYEIAGYAAGDFEVCLPLQDVKDYFVKRK